MRGEYVWFVRCVEYGILRLDFGAPHLSIREPASIAGDSPRVSAALQRRLVVPTGKWHLFIEYGLWSVEAGGFRCSRTDDPCDTKALGQLEGQKLTSVRYVPEAGEWVFDFDLSGKLSIGCPKSSPEGESQWILFFEDGTCLAFDDAAHISIEE